MDKDFPCEFACCLICIFNPEQIIDDKEIETVQNILGIGISIVEAHI